MKELSLALLLLLIFQPFSARWAVLSLLLVAHIDLSGVDFDSAGSVGWANAAKALVLPAWLLVRGWNGLVRSRGAEARRLAWRVATRPAALLWLLLAGYAATAVLWSPHPLAGVKLAAALVSHTVVFCALLFHWLSGRLDERSIYLAMVLTVALGALQTYGLGNAYGTGEGQLFFRFTTFGSPQSFAESFVALGMILLWCRNLSLRARIAAVALLLAGAFLSGSRIGLFGALAGIAVWLLRGVDWRRLTLVGVLTLGAVGIFTSSSLVDRLAGSRIGEAVTGLRSGIQGIEEVGSFGWRLDTYRCLWEAQKNKRAGAWLFGSGTASLGVPGLDCEPTRYDPARFSPNRVAHCEPLRALYEWGLLGLALLLVLVAVLVRATLRWFRLAGRGGAGGGWQLGPAASALPLLLLALAFENVLQGALSPGAVGFLAVLSQAAAASLDWAHPSGRNVRPAGPNSSVETPEG